ncbi:MAG: Cell division protein ZapD [Hydrocarboniphaga sp.]|uniref:cell division protein ZapD n=1 Tax=Hydrocarboniphaga sp. TaxID=2033016 RepID=UPI00263033A9|nr:cell division protein ZapD [Hydrocarboniphaga sp.]MDB5971932.1 Cell division protein ZapD [Hydrocarboniphaga sp.]
MTSGSAEALDSICFEQPLNERVRTFLRLEFLFGQHAHHRQDRSQYGLRARLQTLLDTLTVLSRSDLKKDILKELLEQHAHLTRLSARPGVDPERLGHVLKELTTSINGLQQLITQFAGSALRDNEFLISIHNRTSIPGGTCGFDLPAYHFWLSQPYETVNRNLEAWFTDLAPFEVAIGLYLKLLRGSTEPTPAVARGGLYVHAPQGPVQLLRVFVPQAAAAYPEISAGAHRFTIRFVSLHDVNRRSTQVHSDVPFNIQCCAL